jgi:hypothetical protein
VANELELDFGLVVNAQAATLSLLGVITSMFQLPVGFYGLDLGPLSASEFSTASLPRSRNNPESALCLSKNLMENYHAHFQDHVCTLSLPNDVIVEVADISSKRSTERSYH